MQIFVAELSGRLPPPAKKAAPAPLFAPIRGAWWNLGDVPISGIAQGETKRAVAAVRLWISPRPLYDGSA